MSSVFEEYITGTGQRLKTVHGRNPECDLGCAIHAPSDHHMREWKTNWRSDTGVMERMCEHGVGHPDPDSLDWTSRHRGTKQRAAEALHGCDGCCVEEATKRRYDPYACPDQACLFHAVSHRHVQLQAQSQGADDGGIGPLDPEAYANIAVGQLPQRFFPYRQGGNGAIAVVDLAAVTRIEWRRRGDKCVWEAVLGEEKLTLPGDPELPKRWAQARFEAAGQPPLIQQQTNWSAEIIETISRDFERNGATAQAIKRFFAPKGGM